MVTDPIADFLVQIKNGYMSKLDKVELPYSGIKERLAEILAKHGYLKSVEVTGDTKKTLKVALVYAGKAPVLTNVERVSKPGRRVYVNRHDIPRVFGGFGITIISTPKGLVTDKEARQLGIGGEVICKIW